jgi:hypothetical protein
MKRLLIISILFLGPVVGVTVGTAIAWKAFPDRPVPENASHQESLRIINQGLEDSSVRGTYILWGAIAGAATGVLAAVALYASSKPKSAKL